LQVALQIVEFHLFFSSDHLVYLMKTNIRMQGQVQLSVILTTHSDDLHFQELLSRLSSFGIPWLEIIVINDAASSDTSGFIHQALRNVDNDNIFLFEHDKQTGRGNSLNEALVQASAPFVWAPRKASRLNKSLLADALHRFKSDSAAFWVLDYTLPDSAGGWLDAAQNNDLPDDDSFIWNRNIIRHEQLFFNPYMNTLHGAELAMRLQRQNSWNRTDPFFVLSESRTPVADFHDMNELMFSCLRSVPSMEERREIIDRIGDLKPSNLNEEQHDLLINARQLLFQGDAKRSLSLANQILKKQPKHYEALRIKIQSLEKLRQHVEASELKHSLQKLEDEEASQATLFSDAPHKASEPPAPDIELSVIIPTTGLGKPLLEQTLIHLEKAVNPDTTELIIVDNASIDDTFDYLQQLQKVNFINIRVITHSENIGFGASVNRGIEKASGDFTLVMHNDVQVDEMCVLKLLEVARDTRYAGLITPSFGDTDETSEETAFIDTADSSCFLIRTNSGIRFDEEYRLCHFDMEDFCMQLHHDGKKIIRVNHARATHRGGKTFDMMGISLVPHLKWENRKRYYDKWEGSPEFTIPNQGTHPDRFERLGMPENPLQPESSWVHAVQDYLTDEVKTEILRTDWNQRELITIISTLLIADERELLRTLEDRLDDMDIAPALAILFIYYYFEKNIYSRCMHYLEKASGSHPVFDLFRLKIYVEDKEAERAAPILSKMLKKYPASPDLFYLAGELYQQNGEEGEAKSFFAMAGQLDPYRFRQDETAFEL
jgi:glycosyltransferase involved in cell wall biosynthesis